MTLPDMPKDEIQRGQEEKQPYLARNCIVGLDPKDVAEELTYDMLNEVLSA